MEAQNVPELIDSLSTYADVMERYQMLCRVRKEAIMLIRRNLGAPFIIGFIIILVLSSFALALGLKNEANQLAIYGFYLLVLGILLEVASYVKDKDRRSLEDQPVEKWDEIVIDRTKL